MISGAFYYDLPRQTFLTSFCQVTNVSAITFALFQQESVI